MSESQVGPGQQGGGSIATDVIVLGAGLAGTTAAILLRRQGIGTALLDARAVYPPDFRAEKLGPPHLEGFRRLGLEEVATSIATPIESIDIYREGRFAARVRQPEYGFAYPDLVNALRARVPGDTPLIVGRVAGIETGPDRQRVVLNDGRTITARLVVVATGLGDQLKRKLGITREILRPHHSISLGFFLEGPARSYAFESLGYYGLAPQDRFAYLTLFPTGDDMRANMFVYRPLDDPWIERFRREPASVLAEAMPGLREVCRSFRLKGRPDIRPIDLSRSLGVEQPGVALVGDACSTSCPAPGVGMRRVLTDVERLCLVHIPDWLRSPGMGRDKIAAYYADPVKRDCDETGLRMSLFARNMAVDPALPWAARRLRNRLVRRGRDWLRRFGPDVAPSGGHDVGMMGSH